MPIKVILTDDELGLPAVDELMDMAIEYARSLKEVQAGRKTRSANKKTDVLYEKIMNYTLPPIKTTNISSISSTSICNNSNSAASKQSKLSRGTNRSTDSCLTIDSDSESSRPITRSLRSRSKTPTLQQQPQQQQNSRQQKQSSSGRSTPCTPQFQKIRNNTIKTPSSTSGRSVGSGQASATKLRLALRADSAQKKREQEKERQEKLLLDRKVKEERAEAKKRQLLEERAIKAKLKREERLNHAAEVRKAREQARSMLKQQEERRRAQFLAEQQQQIVAELKEAREEAKQSKNDHPGEIKKQDPNRQSPKLRTLTQQLQLQQQQKAQQHQQNHQPRDNRPPSPPQEEKQPIEQPQQEQQNQQDSPSTPPKASAIDETFKVPAAANNIDIIIQDETDDGTVEKPSHIAAWAKAPHLRNALIEQFSKPYDERIRTLAKIFQPLRSIQDIDLGEIFGPRTAVNKKYICRTSSAVWSPANRSVKRSNSELSPMKRSGD